MFLPMQSERIGCRVREKKRRRDGMAEAGRVEGQEGNVRCVCVSEGVWRRKETEGKRGVCCATKQQKKKKKDFKDITWISHRTTQLDMRHSTRLGEEGDLDPCARDPSEGMLLDNNHIDKAVSPHATIDPSHAKRGGGGEEELKHWRDQVHNLP